MLPQLRAVGATAVVMVHEDVDDEVAVFRHQSWPTGNIYYDRLKYVYRVLGDGGIPTGSVMKAAFRGGGKEYMKARKELKAKGKSSGNAKGSYSIFGGVVGFNAGGRVAFMHKEEGIGDRMDFHLILEQVKTLQHSPDVAAAAASAIGHAAAAAVTTDPVSAVSNEATAFASPCP